MIYLYQEARDFSASELRAGRLPLWQPANYAGAPFAVWPKYSPFELLYYLAPNPITLAWIALLQAITVGLGMWLFLSRCLKLTFWSAALASWCAPLTGFITLWHGSLPLGPVLWLPWSLWAVDGAVKNPWGNRTLAVAIVTALLLLTGHPGMGGLVLLTTGMYFVWTLTIERLLRRQWKAAASSVAGVTMAWLIGFLIGAPTCFRSWSMAAPDTAWTSARRELRNAHRKDSRDSPPSFGPASTAAKPTSTPRARLFTQP